MAEPRNDKVYLGYLASSHFIIHVYTMLLPVLLLPFRDELGINLIQLSLLASIPRLLNVFIYIPTGVISDQYPAETLSMSFFVTMLGALAIPLSNGFYTLLAGFILLSVGSTLYHPPSLKMASNFDPTKMSLAMGIHNIGSSIGFAAGPLLLGLFMTRWGWRFSFYVWAVFTLLMGVLSFRYTRKTLTRGKKREISFLKGIKDITTKDFLIVVAMSTLVEAIFNILVTYVPAYFTIEIGLSYSLTSIISGLGPLTGILGSVLGGYTGDRFGKYRMGILVNALLAGFLFIFPSMRTLMTVAVIYALYRCLQAAFMPLLNSMIASHSSLENRSLAYSFNFVMVNLFGSLATTGASVLIEGYSTRVIFPICIAAIVPVCALIWLLSRYGK
ncbi:MFS transporter [Candidatus Bathyarchaeota archaeon]|jgi:FSR family fosmidomycin resistance protein-like MFS transporter|nr:MFS transporter [Candidatus Bathyarchaeota archaeon]MCJ7731601.1 MFS transporter [Candidatus Bathyarchaeota archaeon]TFH18407.1 MAG: MFS transporter [Candidatus Bathyarchaeota archaeon]